MGSMKRQYLSDAIVVIIFLYVKVDLLKIAIYYMLVFFLLKEFIKIYFNRKEA